jgi:hypothetical protein
MIQNGFGKKLFLAAVLVVTGCTDAMVETEDSEPIGEDLPMGDVLNDRADGFWGAATECKQMPDLEPLADPKIVVSLDGLTLHLWDEAGTYDKVFPIGVGAIEDGESLTPTSTQYTVGKFHTRTDATPTQDGPTPDAARWGWNQQCRVWWTDEDGEKLPVFAGLPFIRLAGHPHSASYGIHGPVDQYPLPSGGILRRGYVSHGCIRMSADGIGEVWARLQGHRADVTIQKPVERLSDGTAVQYDPWLLAECSKDSDCDFDGGFCRENEYTGRGFCTKACSRYCPDRAGHAMSFCVPDPDTGEGICTLKAQASTNSCRRFDGFVEQDGVYRPDRSSSSDVCLPGSQGWIGDGCLADSECDTGYCTPIDGGPRGICAQSCSRYCPDKDGHAVTFCVNAPESIPDEGGICVARCAGPDDCGLGTTCEASPRHSQSSVVRNACVPSP